ncbi:MAG: hypothetical protein WDO72_00545 [Pseudomonadota bacterium]
MNQPPNEHSKTLREIDRLLAEAPDEAARAELLRLRARLDAPELRDMARELEGSAPRPRGNLVLEFHDPLLPGFFTATGCVISAAVCLFAVLEGLDRPAVIVAGTPVNLWIVAAFAGACTALFTALSFQRSFSIRFDTEGMMSTSNGARWSTLRVGAMRWASIRSLHERARDGVLEVRAADGAVLELPMRVVNYRILHQHLENMVVLYGERS